MDFHGSCRIDNLFSSLFQKSGSRRAGRVSRLSGRLAAARRQGADALRSPFRNKLLVGVLPSLRKRARRKVGHSLSNTLWFEPGRGRTLGLDEPAT